MDFSPNLLLHLVVLVNHVVQQQLQASWISLRRTHKHTFIMQIMLDFPDTILAKVED